MLILNHPNIFSTNCDNAPEKFNVERPFCCPHKNVEMCQYHHTPNTNCKGQRTQNQVCILSNSIINNSYCSLLLNYTVLGRTGLIQPKKLSQHIVQ